MQANPLSLSPDLPMISIILLFGVFALVALVAFAIVAALVSRRFGLAAILGGLTLSGAAFVMLALLFVGRAAYYEPSSGMHSSISSTSHAEMNLPHVVHHSWGRISVVGLIFGALFLAFVIGGVLRATNSKCDGTRRGWPALLLIPLAFFLVFSGVRVTKTTQVNGNPSPPVVNTFPPPPPQAPRDVHNEIEHGDIHMLMDKSDAPRIDLVAEAAAGVTAIMQVEERSTDQEKPADTSAKQELQKGTSSIEAVATASVANSNENELQADTDDDEARIIAVAAKSTKADGTSDDIADEKRDDKEMEPSNNSTKVEADTAAATHSHDELQPDESQPTAPRPEWVTKHPGRDGDAWQEVISTDEYATDAECRRATDIYLMLKTHERFQTLAGRPFVDTSLPSITFNKGQVLADGKIIYDDGNPESWSDGRLNELLKMGIGIDYIRREIVDKQHVEQTERTFGPMYKMFTLVKFTPAVDAELRRNWAYVQRQDQFGMVGVGAASVLGLLGLIYGLLKVDTATKGYYTKRLFIGVPAAIIGGTALFSLLVEILT
jgi:hypothetical protein